MPNTDNKMLRDGLAKVTGIIERHERMMQEMGE